MGRLVILPLWLILKVMKMKKNSFIAMAPPLVVGAVWSVGCPEGVLVVQVLDELLEEVGVGVFANLDISN